MNTLSQTQEEQYINKYCQEHGIELPRLAIEIGERKETVFSPLRNFITNGWKALFVEHTTEGYEELSGTYSAMNNVKVCKAAIVPVMKDNPFDKLEPNDQIINNDESPEQNDLSMTWLKLIATYGLFQEKIGLLNLVAEDAMTGILENILLWKSPVFLIVESNTTFEQLKRLNMLSNHYCLLNNSDKKMLLLRKDYMLHGTNNNSTAGIKVPVMYN